MIFVDASALIAIITDEDGDDRLADLLEADANRARLLYQGADFARTDLA